MISTKNMMKARTKLLHQGLFEGAAKEDDALFAPLAERMRPLSPDDFVGQEEILGPGSFLRRMIENDKVPSMILFGPPGTGKTTLARMVAHRTDSEFKRVNAVAAGIADLRQVVAEAKDARELYQKRTIIFIDEIHRFNKGQQDVLLPYVEDGRLTLIGATTENPFFEVNHALLSRVKIVRLNALNDEDIAKIVERAIKDKERGLGGRDLKISREASLAIAGLSGGDARIALNILEEAAEVAGQGGEISLAALKSVVGERVQKYDKKGDNHYDTISAFIKSMRGSDPDAAIHYLARMIAGGEDIEFIARRVAICAAEDVGLADPMALVLAMAAVEAVRFVGLPEARIPLAEAVVYIAGAPKSNAAYLAIDKALSEVRKETAPPVPIHLRDSSYKGAKQFGHGVDYVYPHDFPHHFTPQQYLPEEWQHKKYYQPGEYGREKFIRDYLHYCWPERW